MQATVLIVDDVQANRELLRQTLEPGGCEILLASDGESALKAAHRTHPDVILLDVMMPGMNGFETARRLRQNETTLDIPIIFITAQHETPNIVEGFRAGGVDYITKPFQVEEVLARVETHLKVSRLMRELAARNKDLETEIARRQKAESALQTADEQLSLLSKKEAERWGIDGLIGQSKALGKIVSDVRKLQPFASTSVLIIGESGTGKELIARSLHYGSPRGTGPFLAVNCAGIPESLAESLLFGHLPGSFSGAAKEQKGYFELANSGTLFLDEVGDMPAALQTKFLRVLETGMIMPIGATREKKVDVRVVAATNANLLDRIGKGEFRQDLYFRLNQFCIVAPPLRERPDDIPLLAAHFLKLYGAELGIPVPNINGEAIATLQAHPFPGNVRELKNVIMCALIESSGREIRNSHLRLTPSAVKAAPLPSDQASTEPHSDLPLNLEQAELVLIKRALELTNHNYSKAADMLGVNRARIYRALPKVDK